MKISNAIYRLSKLARVLDIDGCEEDVFALNMAVNMMSESLRDDQADVSSKKKIIPIEGRRGNSGFGVIEKIQSRIN